MRTITIASAIASAASLFACSSASGGAGGSDVSQICSKFVSCGLLDSNGSPYTQSSCISDLDTWVPGGGCTSTITSASCGTLNTQTATSVSQACWPSCPAPGTNTCSGDDVVECSSSGTQLTFDCSAVCSANGQTYTGVCGPSYQGQSAGSVGQTCWCK